MKTIMSCTHCWALLSRLELLGPALDRLSPLQDELDAKALSLVKSMHATS